MSVVSPGEVLDFWIGAAANSAEAAGEKSKLWFGKSDNTDAEIVERFSATINALANGLAADWADRGAHARLAAVIVLDQFSRNAFRGEPEAFANDAVALSLSLEAIEMGEDKSLSEAERAFLYLPLEHAESKDMQARSVAKFAELAGDARDTFKPICDEWLDYAHRHKDVIDRFGRFPHRNEILGRLSTSEEAEYLAQPGSGF